jgi:2-hydroxychromene-2-carboxylate isomerase
MTTFYFDLGSPYAYLTAERIDAFLPDATWQPVLLGGLFKLTGRSSWALGDFERRRTGMADVERRARDYGLAPLRWPDPWPSNYLLAMRAATAAFAQGIGREFVMHAFRDQFQHGRGLHLPENVIAAADVVGVTGLQTDEVKHALRDATQAAYERGVFGVPTVAVGGELFWGDDRLEEAAA